MFLQDFLHLVIVFSDGVGELGRAFSDEEFPLSQRVVLTGEDARQLLEDLQFFPRNVGPGAPQPVDRVALQPADDGRQRAEVLQHPQLLKQTRQKFKIIPQNYINVGHFYRRRGHPFSLLFGQPSSALLSTAQAGGPPPSVKIGWATKTIIFEDVRGHELTSSFTFQILWAIL